MHTIKTLTKPVVKLQAARIEKMGNWKSMYHILWFKNQRRQDRSPDRLESNVHHREWDLESAKILLMNEGPIGKK